MGKNKAWADFLLDKLHELEKERGERISVTSFAEYLEDSQQNVSRWLTGTTPEPYKYEKLGSILGHEFYDLMNAPKPDPWLTYIKKLLETASPETKEKVARILEEDSGGKQESKHRGNAQPNQQH